MMTAVAMKIAKVTMNSVATVLGGATSRGLSPQANMAGYFEVGRGNRMSHFELHPKDGIDVWCSKTLVVS